MAVCPGCGKRIAKGVFCEKCEPLPELSVRELKLKLCSSCGNWFVKNKWTKFSSPKDAVSYLVKDALKNRVKDSEVKVKIPSLRIKSGIRETAEAEVLRGRDYYMIPVEILVTKCNKCAKENTPYLEGTLQLRNVKEDMLKFAEDFLRERKAFINREAKVKNGVDLDVTSQKHIQTLGNRLQEKYGGILKISPRLFSQDHLTSKNIYRVNVYFEAFPFSKGDVIKVDNRIVKITNPGKLVSGESLKDGKKVTLDLKKSEYSVLERHSTTVSKVFPEVEVLHPLTYQSTPVQNPREVKPDEKVKVVLDNESIYLA